MQDSNYSEKSRKGSLELFQKEFQTQVKALMQGFQNVQLENRIAQRLQIIRHISGKKMAVLEASGSGKTMAGILDCLYWFQVELRQQVYGLRKDISVTGLLP